MVSLACPHVVKQGASTQHRVNGYRSSSSFGLRQEHFQGINPCPSIELCGLLHVTLHHQIRSKDCKMLPQDL